MDHETRRAFEARAGASLDHLRLHTGPRAASLAQSFGAAAYAVGGHVVLGDGPIGPALLAHETAHAAQQSAWRPGWQDRPLRFTSAGDPSEREADAFSAGEAVAPTPAPYAVARQAPGPTKQKKKSSQVVLDAKAFQAWERKLDNLVKNLPPSPDPNHKEKPSTLRPYVQLLPKKIRMVARQGNLPTGKTELDYLQSLESLLSTPKAHIQGGGTGAKPKQRYGYPGARLDLMAESAINVAERDFEEKLTASLKSGQVQGKKVAVSKSQRRMKWAATKGIADIYRYGPPGQKVGFKRAHIHMRVFLEPKRKTGAGKADDEAAIHDIKRTSQEIEDKAGGGGKIPASRPVTLDLEFVDQAAPNVTKYTIDVSGWPDAGNAWGPSSAMVEELFHSLGLLDSYDYIDAHATNDAYGMQHRIGLFNQQIDRYAGREARWRPRLPSITQGSVDEATDWDYCQILTTNDVQLKQCMKERAVR